MEQYSTRPSEMAELAGCRSFSDTRPSRMEIRELSASLGRITSVHVVCNYGEHELAFRSFLVALEEKKRAACTVLCSALHSFPQGLENLAGNRYAMLRLVRQSRVMLPLILENTIVPYSQVVRARETDGERHTCGTY